MMVVTAKIKKRNIFIVLAAIAAIIALLFLPGNSKEESLSTDVSKKIETNEQRIAYLQEFGWEIEQNPAETQEVVIPTDENEIFSRYNELQKSQGFDLTNYAGKAVKRYVYEITNHPGDAGSYRATLLIHKGRVIGGDVASMESGGKMHGLQMPS